MEHRDSKTNWEFVDVACAPEKESRPTLGGRVAGVNHGPHAEGSKAGMDKMGCGEYPQYKR